MWIKFWIFTLSATFLPHEVVEKEQMGVWGRENIENLFVSFTMKQATLVEYQPPSWTDSIPFRPKFKVSIVNCPTKIEPWNLNTLSTVALPSRIQWINLSLNKMHIPLNLFIFSDGDNFRNKFLDQKRWCNRLSCFWKQSKKTWVPFSWCNSKGMWQCRYHWWYSK